MPRVNYVTAWADLKDILIKVQESGAPSVSPTIVLHLMLSIEHRPVDWGNLYEILQYLKTPHDH